MNLTTKQGQKYNIESSEETSPTLKQFLINMEGKMKDKESLQDIYSILKPEVEYDNNAA